MTERCSDAALLRGDPLLGTAPAASRWLLVEQNGGWLEDAAESVRATAEQRVALEAALRRARARLELIRRPGRLEARERPRWAVFDIDLGVEVWGERGSDGSWGGALEALADPLAHGARPGAGVLLVCCHGRHDACCAIKGRPLAAALAEGDPALTWECTHLGGDRFAANLAVLPDGVLYGQVQPDEAVALMRDHRAGRPRLDLVRGIAGRTPPGQTPQGAAAGPHGTTPWDRGLAATASGTGESWAVLVTRGEASVLVKGHDEVTPPRRLTCGAALKIAVVPVVDAVTL